jgi:serine protease Do
VNPGNSGGPLFNLHREVVGINTAIVGGGTGIGFAIPSAMVKALLPQLERGEQIRRGWLGVSVQDLTPALAKALRAPEAGGAVVASVEEGSPAARAGVKAEDVVVAVDGKAIGSSRELTRTIGFTDPGKSVTLTIYRNGDKRETKVELGARPGERTARGESRDATESLGLAVANVDPQIARQLGISPRGALVTAVRPGSPAEEAGLAAGMVVVEAGGEPVANARDLARKIREGKPGSVLLLRVQVEEGRFLRALELPA